MCNDKESFADLHEGDPFNVAMGDKSKAQACGRGYVDVILYVGQKPAHNTLTDMLFVPNLNFNLVSVAVMDKLGYRIMFENGMCQVFRTVLSLLRVNVGRTCTTSVPPLSLPMIPMTPSLALTSACGTRDSDMCTWMELETWPVMTLCVHLVPP